MKYVEQQTMFRVPHVLKVALGDSLVQQSGTLHLTGFHEWKDELIKAGRIVALQLSDHDVQQFTDGLRTAVSHLNLDTEWTQDM